MSDAWAMNPGKAATAVGTATIEADDELFTIASHGLGVGDTVVVDTLTGGASGVLDEGQVYWVVDVSTNTFALSQHRNGAPVAFSSDGGADVYRFAPQFSAIELRRLDSGLLVNDSGDRFGAREGIHPASDPAISVSGTTWTVENVVGVVYPALTSTSGPYRFAHPTESGSLDPADGSNPRIDALDLQIQDNDEDASGQRRARVVYVAGAPGGDPDPPAQTSNSLRLGTILVPAGGSPSPSVSDDVEPQFTVASGGTTPVRTDSEGPASPYVGQMRYRIDDDVMEVWDGSAWQVIARPNAAPKGWTPIDSGTHSGGSFQIDVTDGGRFPAGTFSMMRLHLYGDLDASGTVRLHINDSATAGEHQSAMQTFNADTGAQSPVHAAGSNHWYLANWSTVTGCTAEVLLMNTDESDAVAFHCVGGNPSPTDSDMIGSLSWGRLTANHLVDTLEPRPLTSGSNLFAELAWRLEGYRA